MCFVCTYEYIGTTRWFGPLCIVDAFPPNYFVQTRARRAILRLFAVYRTRNRRCDLITSDCKKKKKLWNRRTCLAPYPQHTSMHTWQVCHDARESLKGQPQISCPQTIAQVGAFILVGPEEQETYVALGVCLSIS